jgi:peptide chain release factor 3
MHPPPTDERLRRETERRRTFAVISHPDAGKTTLTEKLLLYGGAIHLAGAVKAKASQRNTTSDWMEIERQRGISISTSVLCFEFDGRQLNLLDTPGHKDFSEDTYRTLVAVDSAVMLIDAAKGVEPQTRKLFEVCRLRGIPIFTFINKLDRVGRAPLELIDELEQVLKIRSSPVSWPIGMGDRFRGIIDRRTNELLLFRSGGVSNVLRKLEAQRVEAAGDEAAFVDAVALDEADRPVARELWQELQNDLELLAIAGDRYDAAKVAAGQLTPVFFGSALNNFGVQHFLENFVRMAPSPAPRIADGAPVLPTEPRFSGMFFKIQANMDPQHRDRVAFLRVCSGHFKRGMVVTHGRLGKEFRLNRALNFFARERETVEEAWPGDIVGLIDTTGDFRIGDTLSEGAPMAYEGVPRFSPEFFASVRMVDPNKRKQLKKGLDQLSEEGVIQMFRHPGRGDMQPVLGAVGALQFDVIQHRMKIEYAVDVGLDRMPYVKARWIGGPDTEERQRALEAFRVMQETLLLEDRDGLPVVLFKSDWSVQWTENKYPKVTFLPTAPAVRGKSR